MYRARDTKLKREVAIKILPDEFSRDGDRVGRFQREAEVLASLNHPNIATIHSLEEAGGTRYLVLELVDGETLDERLRRGPIPIDEALAIAKNICEALEAAHDKGIVHRDLKPGNVKITPEGKVKVLDFGLAKALDTTPVAGVNLSNSPTLTMAGTQAGMILGTAAYMSPEQAKGINTDQRSDVFSFGAVLYEILTGRPAFQGDNVSEVLASVLAREPDFGLMPPKLNPQIQQVLRRCLEKNPKRRWHAVGDLRVELETAFADPRGLFIEEQNLTKPRPPLWKRSILVLLTIIFTALIASSLTWWYFRAASSLIVTRFPITLGEGQFFTLVARRYVAISPDGSQIVYVANQRLYRRSMSELEARPIPGAESPGGSAITDPTFSPDGQWLVFYSSADGSLKRIAVTGGAAVPLCLVDPPFGVSWGADGILVGQASKGILRVLPKGGKPESLVAVKPDELAHGPQMLPGGDAILFTVVRAGTQTAEQWDKAQIVVQSLKSGVRTSLIEGGTDAHYLPTGHIVYAYGGALFAIPFDVKRLVVTGNQVAIVQGVRRTTNTGAAQFSFSANGSLIYVAGPANGGQLALTLSDRKGSVEPLKLPQGAYVVPRFSPDGKKIAVGMDDGKEPAIWVYDLSGATSISRLTIGGTNRYPLWAPDGKRIAFQSDREGDFGIFWQAADGSDSAQRLTRAEPRTAHFPGSWSKDGSLLSYTAVNANTSAIHVLSLSDRKDSVFAQSNSALGAPVLSPDGKWMAYHSFETGQPEVWVQPFPNTDGGKRQVSKDGAFLPFWSPDGSELFFQSRSTGLVSVGVATKPSFTVGLPTSLPFRFFTLSTTVPRNIDISSDGKRFVAVVIPGDPSGIPAVPQIQVVLNWFSELQQRVPVK